MEYNISEQFMASGQIKKFRHSNVNGNNDNFDNIIGRFTCKISQW